MALRSPPKHRHDGASPLPLGMDWSPPPRKWDGKETIWPHDSHTGWSYCVMVPSWVIRPEHKTSDGSFSESVVFYKLLVGIQSPEGVNTSRGVFRRFSDFSKLSNLLKQLYPRKNLPRTPPKHRFVRVNSSRALLEERRRALEDWMGKLLSDIDISRSVPVASFLELEAAARSSISEDVQKVKGVNFHDQSGSSVQLDEVSAFVFANNSSAISKAFSVASDYSSDNSYEASGVETPGTGTEHNSEIESEDLAADRKSSSLSSIPTKYGTLNTDNAHFAEGSFSGEVDVFARDTSERKVDPQRVSLRGNASSELLFRFEKDKGGGLARKKSTQTIGSYNYSVRGSEVCSSAFPNSHNHLLGLSGLSESVGMRILDNVQIILPLDQRNKMNRVLSTMERRLATANTDMEDLIARLNQEIAVKGYLTTKVKDLDVEIESTRQRTKEALQQAVFVERENITQMQWDMEELRRKSMELETKLKFEQDERAHAESMNRSVINERDALLRELDINREQLEDLRNRQEEQEAKSKANFKVLVKEVKSLRVSQNELQQELKQAVKDKAELERVLRKENEQKGLAKLSRQKLLHECKLLRDRLQECRVNFLSEEEGKFTVDSSSLTDAMDLLTTSDNRIGLLVAEAQLLAHDDESIVPSEDRNRNRNRNRNDDNDLQWNAIINNGQIEGGTEEDVRKMLTDIFLYNARLRKQVNSVIRCALCTSLNLNDQDKPSGHDESILNKFFESASG